MRTSKDIALVSTLVSLLWSCSSTAPGNPSILVVLLDDASPIDLPTLAEGGVRFERAYVTNPICGPSRANFLEGRFRSSVINGFPSDFDDSDTLATRLHAAGYATGFFGKYINGSQLVDLQPDRLGPAGLGAG